MRSQREGPALLRELAQPQQLGLQLACELQQWQARAVQPGTGYEASRTACQSACSYSLLLMRSTDCTN